MPRRRRKRRDEREQKNRATVKPVVPETASDLSTPDASAAQRHGLPRHATAASLNRATVTQLQRRYGNTAVQRYLVSSGCAGSQIVQRQPKPEKTKAGAAWGSKELAFKTDLSLSSDGKLQLDLGPAIDLKQFGIATKASIDPSGWKGVGELRLGGKGHYLAPKVVVTPDGKATFELGHRFTRDLFSLTATVKAEDDKATVGQSLGWTNPFGMERFDIKAAWQYGLTGEGGESAKIAAGYTLSGSEKDKRSPVLKLIIEGSYKSTGPDPSQKEAKGMLYFVVSH